MYYIGIDCAIFVPIKKIQVRVTVSCEGGKKVILISELCLFVMDIEIYVIINVLFATKELNAIFSALVTFFYHIWPNLIFCYHDL